MMPGKSRSNVHVRRPPAFVVLVLALFAVAFRWARAEEASGSGPELARHLFATIGCAGCHSIADPTLNVRGGSGPDLRRIAAKMKPSRALRWVMAPQKVVATTWMPHLLDESDREEARAIVAYLWNTSQRSAAYPIPPTGDSTRGEALFNSVGCTGCHIRDAGAARQDFTEPYRLHGPNLIEVGCRVDAAWLFAWLRDPRSYAPETRMPDLRLSDREAADLTAFLVGTCSAEDESEELVSADEAEVRAGRDAIELYGCYGCHRIAGFENAGKHAGELSSTAEFSGHGMSGLPDFRLSAREREIIRAAVRAPTEPRTSRIAEGSNLIARYNCRGCHLIEGTGGALDTVIDDPALLPPSLNGEGSKVQPDWLAGFLHDPGTVRLRSWLSVRMPTFGFSEEQLTTIVDYFQALEPRLPELAPAVPPTVDSIELGREAFDLMPCGSCHPTEDVREVVEIDTASLGPPLAIASRRLRYEWIELWIREPQRLAPGTRMPTFFIERRPGIRLSPFAGAIDSPLLAEPKARMLQHLGSEQEIEAFLNDADAVIGAIRDYVWSLGEEDSN